LYIKLVNYWDKYNGTHCQQNAKTSFIIWRLWVNSQLREFPQPPNNESPQLITSKFPPVFYYPINQDTLLTVTIIIWIIACYATEGNKKYKKSETPHVLHKDSIRQHLISIIYSSSTRYVPLLQDCQMLLVTP